MPFPADPVPDGNVFAPHHFVYAAWIVLFLAWYVGTADDKPVVVAGGLLAALFGWYHLWPTRYGELGAVVVLVGLTLATASILVRSRWRGTYSQTARIMALAFLGVAWDDVLNHAFGWWTPLDTTWTLFRLAQYVA